MEEGEGEGEGGGGGEDSLPDSQDSQKTEVHVCTRLIKLRDD